MNIQFVDLKKQYLTIKDEIDNAINTVISETAFIKGKHVLEFEKKYAEMYGVNNCIGVANGTDAIYIALKSLEIGLGDEVITVANSWISTSEAIGQTGAIPVFIDVEEDSFNINPLLIESKINNKTKAIIPVHLYGNPANMKLIIEIAHKNNLYVIEDCAQAHFASINNELVGTFGDIATFSFYPGKNLGAYGDAGAIITNNDDLANKMRMFANHGALIKHQHEIEGINSRLDGLQAAILNVKLNYILEWNKKRVENAKLYNKYLANIDEVKLPHIKANTTHVFHVYCIVAEKRDELKKYLQDNGIPTVLHYPQPLPFLNAYKHLNFKRKDFPVASKNMKEILSLPMFPELREEEIRFIANKISSFFLRTR